MTGLGTMDDEALATFDRLCSLAAKSTDGPGVTGAQVSDAGALARELESEDADPGRVEALAARMGLDPEEVTP